MESHKSQSSFSVCTTLEEMHSYFFSDGLCRHSAHNDHKLIPVAYLVFFATYSKLEILVDDLSVIFT